MITLYGFGPAPGLPDYSPFVVKTMLLLKFAGLDYVVDTGGFRRAPKGKLPYIFDDGDIVADSTFIRWHIEKTRAFDFDAGLTPEQRAIGWAVEKMCEDHLLWTLVAARWLDDDNFKAGVGRVFASIPAFVRPFVVGMVRRDIGKRMLAHGMGRHKPDEIGRLGAKDVEALSVLLGDKPWLFGDQPCGADASAFAMLLLLFDPASRCATRDAALAKPNLVAFRDRVLAAYFPGVAAA